MNTFLIERLHAEQKETEKLACRIEVMALDIELKDKESRLKSLEEERIKRQVSSLTEELESVRKELKGRQADANLLFSEGIRARAETERLECEVESLQEQLRQNNESFEKGSQEKKKAINVRQALYKHFMAQNRDIEKMRISTRNNILRLQRSLAEAREKENFDSSKLERAFTLRNQSWMFGYKEGLELLKELILESPRLDLRSLDLRTLKPGRPAYEEILSWSVDNLPLSSHKKAP